jgi:Ca-activated chloride channel family protein
MQFEFVEVLWLLALIGPGLTAFLWWAWRKKRWMIGQFVQSRLLANLTVGVSTRRQKIRMTLLVVAALLLVVTLARPQWGFDYEEARQRGLDIVVAIDTSKSMLAQDIAPNRLQRAKLAALDLKRLARTDRLGLVAFAGSAFLQCPLSLDDEAFRQSVEALDVNIIPQGGTALAEAIFTALSAFKEKNDNYKVLVLFTDGEDHDGRALEAARDATKESLKIFTIGVGTANGELLPNTDTKGRTDFIKDTSGNVVKSRLDESLLKQIAQATGAFYMLLGGANTMDLLYERGLAPLPKTEHATQRVRRYHERFQWFLGLAVVLLLVEMFLPERKRVSRSETMVNATNVDLRKAVAVLLALVVPVVAWGSSSEALQRYQAGRYDSALREYRRLLNEKPTDARLRFNAGAAAFQAKDYEKAQEYLQAALLSQDLSLQQRTYYNLGNTQYRVGEETTKAEEKQQNWEQAVSSYESALKLDPKDADAKFNLDLVKKKLEELKQQQQQQKKDDKKDEKKNDKKEGSSKQDDQKQQDQKQGQQDKSQQDQKNEDKKSEQDQKQQQEQQSQEQKPKPDNQQGKQGQQKESKGDKPEDESAQQASAGVARMTPQQAQQLLDGQKSEEKAMIFIPQMQTRSNRQDRVFKDW